MTRRLAILLALLPLAALATGERLPRKITSWLPKGVAAAIEAANYFATTNVSYAVDGPAALGGKSIKFAENANSHAFVTDAALAESFPRTYEFWAILPEFVGNEILWHDVPANLVLGLTAGSFHMTANQGANPGGNTGMRSIARGAFGTNTWTHCVIALTNKIGTPTAYFNGVESSTTVGSHWALTAPWIATNLVFGRAANASGASYPAPAAITEFRVWSGIRTNLAHAPTASQRLTTTPEGLILYLPFKETP